MIDFAPKIVYNLGVNDFLGANKHEMKTFDYSKYADTKWNSKVLGLVARINEYKGRQDLFLKQKPEVLRRLIEIAKIQSTEASNKIEGIVTTKLRIKQLCMDKTTPRNRDESEILGYRDVLNTVHESHEYIPIRSNYILQLHRDLYKYSEQSIGGKFKTTQNYISETMPDGQMTVRFMPLEPYETPSAVENLCDEYNKALADGMVEPLVLIPIFIHDFLCIHPFNDGNGRMSRLLTTLLLYRSGFEVGRYISLERIIETTKHEYYDALEASSVDWRTDNNTPIPFIEYLLGVILAAYRDFEARVNVVGTRTTKSDQTVKNAIQSIIGKFDKNDVMERCPSLGRATIENALTKLVKQGIIERHGVGKGTYYTRKE